MLKQIEQTLDSREVAEMVGKNHKNLLRDVARYIEQINESNLVLVDELKIEPVDFFKEGTYSDGKGEMRPCYQITRKGCEFIANKLTGTKGTEFTARYINRFHEMEDIIVGQQSKNQQDVLAQALLEANALLKERDERIRRLEGQGKQAVQSRTLSVSETKEALVREIEKITNPFIIRQLWLTTKNIQR